MRVLVDSEYLVLIPGAGGIEVTPVLYDGGIGEVATHIVRYPVGAAMVNRERPPVRLGCGLPPLLLGL